MTRWPPFFTLAFLAALHFALAMGFANVVPWRTPGMSNGVHLPDIGAPDEFAHANYVDQILTRGTLPVLEVGPAARADEYEDHQPPLFYALDALFGRLCGMTETRSSGTRLPLRGLNALFGAAAVVGTFLLGLWATDRPRVGLAVAAIVALLPMNVALSGAVSNDPLLIALSTFALAVGARALRSPDCGHAVGLGVLTGLAVLTKLTGLLLIATFPFFLKDRRHLAAALAATALLAAPLLVRNVVLYHHPLAATVFNATFPRTVDLAALHTPRGLLRWLYVLLAGTAMSTVGEFGYMDIPLPYGIAVPALVLLLLGLARGMRRDFALVRVRRAFAFFVVLLVASYVAYNLWQVQPQARYLFPALAVPSLVGVVGLAEGRLRPLVGLLLAFLLAGDLYALATLPAQFAERAARAQKPFPGLKEGRGSVERSSRAVPGRRTGAAPRA